MKTDCERFAESLDVRHAVGQEWQQHLQSCPACRRQFEAHRLLGRALGEPPDIDFPRELIHRLSGAPGVTPPPRPQKLGMRTILAGYAVTATLISAWILLTIDWPEILPTGFSIASAIVGFIALLMLSLIGLRISHSDGRWMGPTRLQRS